MAQKETSQYLTKFVVSFVLLLSIMALALSGCVSSSPQVSVAPMYQVDSHSYHSVGQSERVQFIVLHYTAEGDAASLDILTNGNVSAHYLIPRDGSDTIYNLVAEDKRAWHAGSGGFDGRTVLNDTSIGIEIVNMGIAPEYRGRSGDNAEIIANNGYHPYNHYVEFTEIQIEKIAQLVQGLSEKYNINPTHIIGHSDMAPSRKIDPGAKFPWERLYNEYGIGAWYDPFDKRFFMSEADYTSHSIHDIKQAFRDYGYVINDTEIWDRKSQNVVYAFQLHFRPHNANGIMDLETYAILRALIKRYDS